MSLENAMVDRVRYKRMEIDPDSDDEFSTTRIPVNGPWIPCRVHSPTFRETRRDEAYDYQRELTAMVAVEAEDGTAVEIDDLKKTDKIELESIAFGSGEYAILGDPEPVRALEDVVYWKIAIKRWDH